MARQILRIDNVFELNPWLDDLVDVYIKNFSSPFCESDLEKSEVKNLIREICNFKAGVVFVSVIDDQVETFLITCSAKNYAEIKKKYSDAKTGTAMFFDLVVTDL